MLEAHELVPSDEDRRILNAKRPKKWKKSEPTARPQSGRAF